MDEEERLKLHGVIVKLLHERDEARDLAREAYEWIYRLTGCCEPGMRFADFCYRFAATDWIRKE